ncbi:MAG: phosphoesterase, partial [Candidatus Binataceae bacterium]|nr:phosphoesterase [Candidatus Binataceae bacterium]
AAVTAGTGPQSQPTPAPGNTYQGALSMGYYNMSAGDAPLFQSLAQNYAISDNYHQAIIGGSDPAINWITHGDVLFYQDASFNPAVPPAAQIENPNPQSSTNNFYTQDGLLGGSWTDCSDLTQPGITPVFNYLDSLPYALFNNGNCAAGDYYLVNNCPSGGCPPMRLKRIDDALTAAGISFEYYGTDWSTVNANQIVTDIQNNNLPAISFVAPEPADDGHPGFSSVSALESYLSSVINAATANTTLWATTAIIITTDESGGYYDTGYIQPIDFFGDGPRIPLLVVSPYARPGFIDHTYYDHSSLHKFIEKNWGLGPLTSRTRDNLPNPIMSTSNPYVPTNRPALGDLMSMFTFSQPTPTATATAASNWVLRGTT